MIVVARPSIADRRDEIVARVSALLGVKADAVSVLGTTSDGLGFAGSEGVAAWATASVEPA